MSSLLENKGTGAYGKTITFCGHYDLSAYVQSKQLHRLLTLIT